MNRIDDGRQTKQRPHSNSFESTTQMINFYVVDKIQNDLNHKPKNRNRNRARAEKNVVANGKQYHTTLIDKSTLEYQ